MAAMLLICMFIWDFEGDLLLGNLKQTLACFFQKLNNVPSLLDKIFQKCTIPCMFLRFL